MEQYGPETERDIEEHKKVFDIYLTMVKKGDEGIIKVLESKVHQLQGEDIHLDQ